MLKELHPTQPTRVERILRRTAIVSGLAATVALVAWVFFAVTIPEDHALGTVPAMIGLIYGGVVAVVALTILRGLRRKDGIPDRI